MGVVLLRVDERLIHGQVTVGWGSWLRAARYVIVDDRLEASGWEQELYRLAAPDETTCEFVGVEEARRRMGEWAASSEATVILFGDLEHVARVASGGILAGHEVNLGGLHSRPGRVEVARYLFLDETDRARIRDLDAEGVRVWGQDLPGSPRIEAAELAHG